MTEYGGMEQSLELMVEVCGTAGEVEERSCESGVGLARLKLQLNSLLLIIA